MTPEGPCGWAFLSQGHKFEPPELLVEVWGGREPAGKLVSAGSPDCPEKQPGCCSFKHKCCLWIILRCFVWWVWIYWFEFIGLNLLASSRTLVSWSSLPSEGTAVPPPSPSAPDSSTAIQGWRHGDACSLEPDAPFLFLVVSDGNKCTNNKSKLHH